MKTLDFQLSTEYIELIKLLKLLGVSESGADAKIMVEEGLIKCNKEIGTFLNIRVLFIIIFCK